MLGKSDIVSLGLAVVACGWVGLHAATSNATDDPPTFGYSCENCPKNWDNLTNAFAACIDNTEQSPIAFDRDTAQIERLPPLRIHFTRSEPVAERKATNIEVAVEQARHFLMVDRKRFDLLQFHLHSTSEHLVDGERTPLEMHFVHRAGDGSVLVLSLFIVEGDNLDALDPVIDIYAAAGMASEGDKIEVGKIKLGAVLPKDKQSYRYIGSSTTPPCIENVSWILLADAIEMSPHQIMTIQETLQEINDGVDNNRPIQNRNARVVVTDVGRR
jgi:carbonic anhydrase